MKATVQEKDRNGSQKSIDINNKLNKNPNLKAEKKDRLLKRIINGYCQWLLIIWKENKKRRRAKERRK